MRSNVKGTIYLLHFEQAYHHARHYLGWTENTVETRVQQHLSGQGSPLVKAVVSAGINVVVSRTWEDVDRNFERDLKNKKRTPSLCPLCLNNLKVNKGEKHD